MAHHTHSASRSRPLTAALLGLALAALAAGCGTGSAAKRAPIAIPAGDAPAKGPEDALVTVVEISDFQCPYCAKVQPVLRDLAGEYEGKLRFVFKNNPLARHERARDAAVAALAAARQGRFQEMKQLLFANQRHLTADRIIGYAQQLGLDVARFRSDVSDPALAAQVKADEELARKLGARSTPSFFINGRLLAGAKPLSTFKEVIDDELAKAERLIAEGVPPARVSQVMTWLNVSAAGRRQPARVPRKTPKKPRRKGRLQVGFTSEHPVRGAKDALVTLVVFHDYQCPFCARHDRTVEELLRRFPDDVRVVLRHLPLPNHKLATQAAMSAMAAGDQGSFWEYHARLIASPQALSRPDLLRRARELGLNSVRFQDELSRGKHAAIVEADAEVAAKHGITATPTTLVNGRVVKGAKPTDTFVRIIEEELARAKKIVAEEGLAGEALYERLTRR